MAERKRKPNDPKVLSRAVTKYTNTHYDRIDFKVPSGMRERLREHAESVGEKSLQRWIAGVLEKETGLELVLHGEFPPRKKPKEAQDEGSAE